MSCPTEPQIGAEPQKPWSQPSLLLRPRILHLRMPTLGFDSNRLHFDLREKIEALEHQKAVIEDLTTRLGAAQLECVRLETDINTYKASIAPIRKCPDEVLLMIFEFSTDHNPRLVTRLLSVCQRWYNVAVNGPRLWNHINVTFKAGRDMQEVAFLTKQQIEICLQRSGSLPLHINLDLQHLRSEQEQLAEHLSKCFDVVGSTSFCTSLINLDALIRLDVSSVCNPGHVLDSILSLVGEGGSIMRRWETFHISLPPYHPREMSEAVWSLFCGPAPNLSKIYIMDPDTCQMGNAFYFLGRFTDLSSLEDLTLHGEIGSINFPALNHASVKRLDFRSILVYHQIHLDLTRFTHLEHLTIDNLDPYTPPPFRGPPGLPTDVVSLPRLQTLTMHQCRYTGIIWDIPVLEMFRLGGYAGDLADALPDVKALHFDCDIFQSPYYLEPETTVRSVLKRIISPDRCTQKLTIPATLRSVWGSIVHELTQEQGSLPSLPAIVFREVEDENGTRLLYEDDSESLTEL